GTTIDFTDSFRAFRSGPAPGWLSDNAHRFGFVLPYTPASSPLTGYIDEPWHARWIGRGLAAQLQTLKYQTWTDMCVDDAIAAARAAIGSPTPTGNSCLGSPRMRRRDLLRTAPGVAHQ